MEMLTVISTSLLFVAQILTVFLAARGNRLTWVFSLVVGVTLAFNFFRDTLYLSFAFQIYSIIVSLCGVFLWKNKTEDNRRKICWSNVAWPLLAVMGISGLVYAVTYGLIHYFGIDLLPSKHPIFDCIIPSMQAVAMFLMVRKDINAWIIYLLVDCIYIPLAIISHSYQWLFISFCFFITSAYGLWVYLKAWNNRKNEMK